MRILILTALFVAPLYYYQTREETPVPEIDSIRVKVSAPDRVERLLTVEKPVLNPEEQANLAVDGDREPATEEEEIEEAASESNDLEHVEEVQWTDLEQGWNDELKQMLIRMEPAEGEEIHKTYMDEQQSYQAQLDALLNEKQQKTSDEASMEIDQLIQQLDEKHQNRLKEVLGAHYEAVRDHYEDYMNSAQPAE